MPARGQALLFNRFTWLYLLLCFPFIDYFLRRILPLPVISSLWDELLLLLLTGIALWRWLETNRPKSHLSAPLTAFVVLGIAYLVFNMKMIGVSVEGFRAVYQYIVAFLIGYHLLETFSQARRVIHIFTWVAAAVALYGAYQWIVSVPVPASWCDASEAVCRRAFSIVQSPNVLGSYMVLMSPVAIGLSIAEKGKIRWVWAALALLMLATLVFTGSRGAWLAFVGAIGLFSLFVSRKLFIALAVCAVLAAVFVPQVSSRLDALFSSTYLEKSTSDGRIARWLGAYDVMRNDPLFGLGLGRYGGAVADRHFNITYVDSYYFKTLAEIGLVGLTIYLWLMLMLLRRGYQIWNGLKGTRDYFVYGGVLAGLLGVILHNGVENLFEVPFMNTFFWLLAGILFSLPHLKQDGTDQRRTLT